MNLPPDRFPIYDRLIFAVFVIAMPVAIASGARIFNDGDVSWHIAAGRWIIDNLQIPQTDPFSFTMAGQPWVAFEWGAEVIYASAFDGAGYSGLSAVVATALIVMFAVMFLHFRSRVGPIGILVAFVCLTLLLQPFMLARPHLLAWPLLAAWTTTLLASRDAGGSPPFAAVLLMFVWANVHGSFAIGLVIAGAVGLDAMISSGWAREKLFKWSAFGALSLTAALLNANGLRGFLHPFTVSGMETLPLIEEWMPSSPAFNPLFYLAILGSLGAILFKRPKFSAGEIILLLILLTMALLHIRHQAVLAIVGAIIVVPRLSNADRSLILEKTDKKWHYGWRAAAALGALFIISVRMVVPVQPKENFANPWNLIAHVPADLRAKAVFHDYSFGGPLILSGIHPFIDGRADMYGDAFVSNYVDILNGDARKFGNMVKRYDIRWTMLQHQSSLVAALDQSPHWTRVYSDKIGVIHRRRSQAHARPGD